jgi:alpha-N-acetylglucosamine transferase
MNMLQYVWFTMPALWDWNSVSILHYQYEKPWEQNHPKADRLKPLIDLWHHFHTGHSAPDVAALVNPKEAA